MQIHINKLQQHTLSKNLQKRFSMQRYANFLIINGVKSKGNGTKFELAESSRVTRALPCQVQQKLKGWVGTRNTPIPLFAWWRYNPLPPRVSSSNRLLRLLLSYFIYLFIFFFLVAPLTCSLPERRLLQLKLPGVCFMS